MELTYPSARYPGPPVIRIDVPDGWEAADSPTANITVFDTDSPEDFRVNLMVSVRRMQTQAPIEKVAARFAEETRSRFPQFEIVGESLTRINGLDAVARAQVVVPLGSPYPLYQAEVLLFGPPVGEGLVDLIQVHATCPGDHAERYSPVFRTIVESLQAQRPAQESPASVV